MTCPMCRGRGGGYHTRIDKTRDKVQSEWVNCSRCGGSGTIPDPPKDKKK